VKGKKTDLSLAECAIARSLDLIGDWWSLLIIRDALQGKERFSEFQKSLGLAKNILSSRLKKLVAEGIFDTVPGSEGSAYGRYVLTPRGEQLCVVLTALWQWGEEACFRPGELKRTLVDVETHEPLAKLVLRAQDGRLLGPRDFVLAARAAPSRSRSRRAH
jgi:DNA-binding HxlR family transcriptional regulator